MPPELEEVDIEAERLKQQEEIELKKGETQEKWLEETKQAEEKVLEKKEAFIPWDDDCELPAPDQEAIEKRQKILEGQQ